MSSTLRSSAFAFPLLLAMAACGHSESSSMSYASHSISIDGAEKSWAQKIEYRTESGEVPSLTLDGVRFELEDSTAYSINWGAIGMDGITTIGSMSYESTREIEDEFFTVHGKEVKIVDGGLSWGAEDLGEVEAGTVFGVGTEGLKRKP